VKGIPVNSQRLGMSHCALFWTVTGRDFGRANAWAKRQPNRVREQIKAAKVTKASK
jgi:hypothetical protein